MVHVDKGEWDKTKIGAEKFYRAFLTEAYRVLNDNGTIWIFGTMHNIYLVGYLLQSLNFKILNNITWQKENPAPNLSERMFTHSTETIIWAKKNMKSAKQIYNSAYVKKITYGDQMKDVWVTPTIERFEKKYGYHPTQKPLSIMKRIILTTTSKNSLILDPFVGSGTTCVAGKVLERRVIGVDSSRAYLEIARKRLVESYKAREGRIR